MRSTVVQSLGKRHSAVPAYRSAATKSASSGNVVIAIGGSSSV
jgi:hypothetical protein